MKSSGVVSPKFARFRNSFTVWLMDMYERKVKTQTTGLHLDPESYNLVICILYDHQSSTCIVDE